MGTHPIFESDFDCLTEMTGRLLHYVYKIPHRGDSVKFYRDLGMKSLRHEEFTEGCEAQCNGPYSGHWSKTMIGYGDEDNHFVAELTYNYGVRTYEPGNMHIATLIKSPTLSSSTIKSPCGYRFDIIQSESDKTSCGVRLASSDLKRTENFWISLAKLNIIEKTESKISFNYPTNNDGIWIEFEKVENIKPGGNYGRTAISWPTDKLDEVESTVVSFGGKVLTSKLVLPTPGKADVEVVIVADPDGHEVCFVGDEGFRDLSKTDPDSESSLNKAIEGDKSDEWHQKQAARGIKH